MSQQEQLQCETAKDVPGGGKGPLLSPEKSLTLSCNNDQVLFEKQIAQCITTGTGRIYDPETETLVVHPPSVAFTERGRDMGRSIEWQDDLMYCLTSPGKGGRTNSRMVCAPITQFGDKVGTLTARADSSPCVDRGMNVVCHPVAIAFNGDQSEKTRSMGESIEQSPTLRAGGTVHVAQPIAFNGRQDPVHGEVAGALDTDGGTQCIAFAQNQRDEVRDLGNKSGALAAQPGMKQQTYIIQSATMGGNKKQNGLGVAEGPCYTLDCRADHEVAYPEPANTLQGRPCHSHRSDTDNIVRIGYAVRRLTPIECERLQGFEDDWTAGGSDSARYKAIGNSIARPCVDWLFAQISKYLPRLV